MVSKSGTSEDTKTIVTVLVLLFAFPFGVILMWFWPNWPKWVKLLVTVPAVLVVLLFMLLFSVGFMSTFNPGGAYQKGLQQKQLIEQRQLPQEQQKLPTE